MILKYMSYMYALSIHLLSYAVEKYLNFLTDLYSFEETDVKMVLLFLPRSKILGVCCNRSLYVKRLVDCTLRVLIWFYL